MATTTDSKSGSYDARDKQVLVAIAFGAVLTFVGVIGPILGGAESELLGLFGRNYLHDAIHVLHLLLGVMLVGVGYGLGSR